MQEKKKKKSAEQLALEAEAAAEESARQAAAESDRLRAVQAAELASRFLGTPGNGESRNKDGSQAPD